jgi:hypothetical protein
MADRPFTSRAGKLFTLLVAGAALVFATATQARDVFTIRLPTGYKKSDIHKNMSQAKRHALHQYAKTVIPPAPEAGLDAIIVFTDENDQPILPDVEAATAQALTTGSTAPVPHALTGNQLTFTFNSPSYPFTTQEVTDLTNACTAFHAKAIEIMGNPAFSNTVNVSQDPTITWAGLYYPGSNEMVLNYASNLGTACHEMVHAFRDDYIMGPSVFEEGMARCIQIEIFNQLPTYFFDDEDYNYTYFVNYDIENVPGIGGTDGNFINNNGYIGVVLQRYSMGGYLWGKVYRDNPQFFINFHNQLYSRIPQGFPSGSLDSLLELAYGCASTVEGCGIRMWMPRQHIVGINAPVGNIMTNRLGQWGVDYFNRDATGWEVAQTGVTISGSFTDANNNVFLSGSPVTSAYGWAEYPPDGVTYQGRIKGTFSVLGGSSYTFNFRQETDGVYGYVSQSSGGTITIYHLDNAVTPQTVTVVDGAFNFPSLQTVGGRFKVVYKRTATDTCVQYFNKGAWNYALAIDELSIGVPTAPLGLAVSDDKPMSTVTLTWTHNPQKDVVSYNVYRRVTGTSAYTKIASSVQTNKYVDAALPACTNYDYTVTAVDNEGLSGRESAKSAVAATANGWNCPIAIQNNGTMQFSYKGPLQGDLPIKLEVYDISGRLVTRLHTKLSSEGKEITFKTPSGLAFGRYLGVVKIKNEIVRKYSFLVNE